MTPAALVILAVAAPLGLALISPWTGRTIWPLYALAGFGIAAAGLVPGGEAELPGLLFGMALSSDPELGPIVAGTGAVWAASALHARGSMSDGPGARVFACLFGLAMAGNALLVMADDMVSFYVGYSVMSLSAWGLVAHRRTPKSSFAAKVYLAFAIAGELSLFAALMLISAAQDSPLTPRIIGTAPPDLAAWLALAGFGVKAGLVPLHLWLPLAHPAAPVPASAALSGAMLKAGIVGALKLAPPALIAPAIGDAASEIAVGPGQRLGEVLLVLGVFGAVAGGLYGALTAERKTVLAYSSVSQLSLALGLLGAGYAGYADPALVAGAIALFALHHALAKGALFLGVDSGLPKAVAIGAFLMPSLALTGLPLTLGYASKSGFQSALAAGGDAPVDLVAVFSAAAFATALVMARAVSLPWQDAGRTDPWRGVSVVALSAACVLAALPDLPALEPTALPKKLAPAAVLLAGIAVFRAVRSVSLPAGDLLNLIPALRQPPVSTERARPTG